MQDVLRQLVRLSRLDTELGALEREGGELPGRRTALEREREAWRERLEAAHAEIARDELRLRTLESELADAEVLLKRLEQQQYEVTSRDAFQTLLREMEATRDRISTREGEILEGMEGLEARHRELRALEAERREVEARLDAQHDALEARARALAERVAALRQDRDALVKALAAEVVSRYERVALRRRPVVAFVTGEVCSECRMGVPPQLVVQIIEGRSLVACDSCTRLLVHERLGAEEGSPGPGSPPPEGPPNRG